MKNKMLFALILGISVVACQPKGGEQEATVKDTETKEAVKTPKDYEPSKALVDSVSYLIGINFGSFLKNFDFGDVNWTQIRKGVNDYLKAKGTPRDPEFGKQFKVDPNEMNQIFNGFLEMRNNKLMLENKLASDKFFEKNQSKPGVQVSESGLQYIIENPGSDLKATSDKDTVYVRYKGTLLDGTVFDEQQADSVRFVVGRVVKGWIEGLKLVGEGGKVKLFIPSELGYGERAPREIGPNQALLFDVDVCKVLPYKEPVAEPEKK